MITLAPIPGFVGVWLIIGFTHVVPKTCVFVSDAIGCGVRQNDQRANKASGQ